MKGSNFFEKDVEEPKNMITFDYIVLINIAGLLMLLFFYLCGRLSSINNTDSNIAGLKEGVENLISTLENAGDGVPGLNIEDIFNLIDRVISCTEKIGEKYPRAKYNDHFPNTEELIEFLTNLHLIQSSNLNYSNEIISCGRKYLPELRKAVALFIYAIDSDWAIQMD